MTDSITVTREQVEGTIRTWLEDEAPTFWNRYLRDTALYAAAKSFTTALFNNVKVGEEGDKR